MYKMKSILGGINKGLKTVKKVNEFEDSTFRNYPK